jgi:hypothetical protein
MSFQAPCDRPDASPFDRRGTGALNINAGIDSSINADPAHRGTLSTPELELIHQSASYKKAMRCEEEDKLELAAKVQQIRQVQEQYQQRNKLEK